MKITESNLARYREELNKIIKSDQKNMVKEREIEVLKRKFGVV